MVDLETYVSNKGNGSYIAAEQLLDKVCNVDVRVKNALNIEGREYILNVMTPKFDKLVRECPHLITDIQRRIVNYQSIESDEVSVTDFVSLVDWYSMYLTGDREKDKIYFNPAGEYYDLRMNEIINMFLIGKSFR